MLGDLDQDVSTASTRSLIPQEPPGLQPTENPVIVEPTSPSTPKPSLCVPKPRSTSARRASDAVCIFLSTRLTLLLATFACLGLLLSNVFWRERFLGDEG